ncbi:hypothetical protein Bhyg_12804, partial [Pseudolycoriella hygida]
MMENISETDIKIVRAKKTETSTATKKDHPISEVDRSIKPNDTTAMSNIKMKTCEIELHSKDDHVPDHSSHAESDSEFDDGPVVGGITVGCINEVQNDSEFESDADSIPENFPTKPAKEPEQIILKTIGEKYRDGKGYLYSRNNVGSSNCVYLRCMNNVKYHCPARVIIKGGDAVLTIQHSHDSDMRHVDKTRFYDKLAENVRLDPFEKPLKIYLHTKRQMLEMVDDPIDVDSLKSSDVKTRFEAAVQSKLIDEPPIFDLDDAIRKTNGIICNVANDVLGRPTARRSEGWFDEECANAVFKKKEAR